MIRLFVVSLSLAWRRVFLKAAVVAAALLALPAEGRDTRVRAMRCAPYWPATTNSVLQSQGLNTASWSSSASAGLAFGVSADAAVAPDGTTSAERLTLTGGAVDGAGKFARVVQNNMVGTAGVTYTVSLWLKSANATSVSVYVYNNTADQNFIVKVCPVTTTWTRCAASGVPTATFSFGTLRIGSVFDVNAQALPSGAAIDVWGVQYEPTSVATPYLPTTTAAVSAPRGCRR